MAGSKCVSPLFLLWHHKCCQIDPMLQSLVFFMVTTGRWVVVGGCCLYKTTNNIQSLMCMKWNSHGLTWPFRLYTCTLPTRSPHTNRPWSGRLAAPDTHLCLAGGRLKLWITSNSCRLWFNVQTVYKIQQCHWFLTYISHL